MGKAIAFLLLLLISPAAYAQTSHTVGGSSGWTNSGNYVSWANSQTFRVGDSLLFRYGPTHTVDEVTEADYNNCNSGNPITTTANSPTTITLSDAGTRYFICGTSNHCDQGMKLAVTVAASPGTPPPSGGSTPSPPSGAGDTPSPPSTTTSSPPPPPAGNAGSSLGGGKSLMVGLSLALAAMLGLMVMG
ncbi:hypothetical protein C2S52_004326 [Perilla frutescens var. hirtella]|nr:hypothetical protein C2S51_011246 [Perilla frutescens var. frutescens]KAH6793849.1 hypothetical protein C2S52_004326 [Perilla frutescens var. hirtella]